MSIPLCSPIPTTPPPRAAVSAAEMLFHVNAAPGPGDPFDMTADGQRFIVNTSLPTAAPPSLVVLYNWPDLIKKK